LVLGIAQRIQNKAEAKKPRGIAISVTNAIAPQVVDGSAEKAAA
jgi:hypothetical protein